MKIINILMLSMLFFWLTQDDEAYGSKIIEKTIEKGIEAGLEITYQLVRIPIKYGSKIVWKCIKFPVKLGWKMIKIPSKIVLKLAWRLAKVPLKAITPKFLQNQIKDLIKQYERKKIQSKQNIKYKMRKLKNRLKKKPPVENTTY